MQNIYLAIKINKILIIKINKDKHPVTYKKIDRNLIIIKIKKIIHYYQL